MIMDICGMQKEARSIWKNNRRTLPEAIIRLGKIFGDLCLLENSKNEKAVKKELGNIIFSTIKFCDDLGFDSEECIALAIKSYKK
jgi:hypothetical protein